MQVSIIPLYRCNGNCPYCYQYDLIQDNTVLNLTNLGQLLNTVSGINRITDISVFGGELSLLHDSYIKELLSMCLKYTDDVNVQTNLTKGSLIRIVKDNFPTVKIATSINDERPINSKVVDNLLLLDPHVRKSISVLTVVTPSVLDRDIDQLMQYYINLGISDVQFVRYSKSLHSKQTYDVSEKQYSDFISKVLDWELQHKTSIVGNFKIWADRKFSAQNDSNVFINPYGEFGIVEFREDYEHFYWNKSINSVLTKLKINNFNTMCAVCPRYNTSCLADHINPNECHGLMNISDRLYAINRKDNNAV